MSFGCTVPSQFYRRAPWSPAHRQAQCYSLCNLLACRQSPRSASISDTAWLCPHRPCTYTPGPKTVRFPISLPCSLWGSQSVSGRCYPQNQWVANGKMGGFRDSRWSPGFQGVRDSHQTSIFTMTVLQETRDGELKGAAAGLRRTRAGWCHSGWRGGHPEGAGGAGSPAWISSRHPSPRATAGCAAGRYASRLSTL